MAPNVYLTLPQIARVLRMRARGDTYTAIASALFEYEGVRVSPESLRALARRHGAAPDHRRGGYHRKVTA